MQTDAGYIQCPKCGALSGDDWSQCGGSCPMTASPYYNESAEHAFTAADGEDVGHAPLPWRTIAWFVVAYAALLILAVW